MARSSYYAVREGHTIGVFKTWSECSESVSGYPDNDYKKCATEDEAWDFVNADGPSSSSRGTRSATRTSGRTRSSSPGHHPAPRAYPMPRERTPQVPSRRYNIYIDGAAPSNGRAGATAGWGVYYEDEKYEHLNRSERLEGDLQTNNRAELTVSQLSDQVRAAVTSTDTTCVEPLFRPLSKLCEEHLVMGSRSSTPILATR